MSTRPQAPGPNSTTAAQSKQPRSRKAANPEPSTAGRAGSAGGVMLPKEAVKKSSASKAVPTPAKDTTTQDAPKKKPRKLNKDPTSASSITPATKRGVSTGAAELEALKARVRGLEAKVEELYKTAPPTATPRSPRRRGKGRKNSSATTTATLGTLSQKKEQQEHVQEEDEEADEELGRLEDELETARQDLALYNPTSRPRARPTASDDTDHVEEIPREKPGVGAGSDRQVTLSGSYRIPLPATLNPEDVKTIQSGVSAAQNVARSFLDQRRANQALRTAQADAGPPPPPTPSAPKARKNKDNVEPELHLSTDAAGKQSWGEWIGGYSVAISRAVKSIEHEAAMEAQSQDARPASARAGSGTARKKRPGAKTALSGEQVEGLMS
ncbi:uncharacterized protein M421DRAFT_425053 [Didymella exigua CBS 183.55]|uniref:Uncharacterized protein n=1 Tax=Didymella exigua CBS 183.55 TaxID=1150837 RepID=A0A6A5R7R8_9PLEO|nr:uncharacterized protein M421DRAFT_425053 [Didymella exigua CBS 183.55]KAF1924215.1 hypothetical protein M421DRAFT_425053 [Didymella exigua CBS 183.55]